MSSSASVRSFCVEEGTRAFQEVDADCFAADWVALPGLDFTDGFSLGSGKGWGAVNLVSLDTGLAGLSSGEVMSALLRHSVSRKSQEQQFDESQKRRKPLPLNQERRDQMFC